MWTILVQIIAVLLFLYCYVERKFLYWVHRGVPGPVQDLWKLVTFQERIGINSHVYKLLEHQERFGPIIGRMRFFTPALMVNDADLIKQIMIKDFHLFMNKPILKTELDLWNKNLFNAQDEAWKRIRSITSPTFTSGKLRGMHRLMNKCVDMLGQTLERATVESKGVIDTKSIVTGFTIDGIASTSFATEINANSVKDSPFVVHGGQLFRFNMLRIYSAFLMPAWWNRLLGVRSQFDPNHFDFFGNLVREIVRQRKSGQVGKRNDFVQLLMDAFVYDNELKQDNYEQLTADMERDDLAIETKVSKSNSDAKNKLTETEIISQCLIFFTAGFETTASSITYSLFELARNQDVQARLREELDQALSGIAVDSEQYYETVMSGIPYLDAVMKETLRKYPPLVRLERRCGQAGYQIAGITLEKDMVVEISTYLVHHNPKYYPDPEQFKPDRFLPENKHLLVPYTYIPFGIGPRNCIGMRFAYQEIKLCLAKIVTQFVVTPTEQTPERLEFRSGSLLLTSEPFPLKVQKRSFLTS